MPRQHLITSQLIAGQKIALQKIETALRQSEGSVRGAAKRLGLGSEQTLYKLAERFPEVRELLRTHGQGRASAGQRARQRAERRKKPA